MEDGRPNETVAVCTLCGEPMGPGEEMFKYHGFSGPCPKPPLKTNLEQIIATTPLPEEQEVTITPLKFEALLDTRDIGIYLLAAVAIFGNMALAGFFHDRLAACFTGFVSMFALIAIKVPKVAGPLWLVCDLMLIASILSVTFRH